MDLALCKARATGCRSRESPYTMKNIGWKKSYSEFPFLEICKSPKKTPFRFSG